MRILVLCIPLALAGFQDPAAPLRKYWKPVTLDVKDAPANEVLDRIFEQTGERIRIPEEWKPSPITLKLDGASMWRAIDEVCRRDGNLMLDNSRHRLSLTAGPAVLPPVAYAGPVRFSLHDVTRVRELRYPDRADRTEFSVLARWTDSYSPQLHPWPQPGLLEVVRAEDAGGRSLLPPVSVDENFVRSAGGSSQRASSWLLRIQPAGRTDKVLPRLELAWKILFPDEVEDVVFETPTRAAGESRKVGDFTVTLESCSKDGKGGPSIETRVRFHADPSSLSAAARRAIEEIPLERRLLNDMEVDGKPRREYFGTVGDKKPFDVVFRFWLYDNPEPKAVKFRVARRMSPLSIPLVFTDIPLPEVEK